MDDEHPFRDGCIQFLLILAIIAVVGVPLGLLVAGLYLINQGLGTAIAVIFLGITIIVSLIFLIWVIVVTAGNL